MSAAFDGLAERYDSLWTESPVGLAQRRLVWREIEVCFRPGQLILDLGCGTGADAAHLVSRGVRVSAVDASTEMVRWARTRGGFRAEVLRVEDLARLDGRAPSLTELADAGSARETACATMSGGAGLPPAGTPATKLYDGALSNFGALNCVEDLAGVAASLAKRIRPGGTLVICTLGRFCLWESLYYAVRGQFRKAFRRWGGTATASIGVVVHYPMVSELVTAFAPGFKLRGWMGVGCAVPPSYVRLPGPMVRLLGRVDQVLARIPVLRGAGDHRLLLFTRQ